MKNQRYWKLQEITFLKSRDFLGLDWALMKSWGRYLIKDLQSLLKEIFSLMKLCKFFRLMPIINLRSMVVSFQSLDSTLAGVVWLCGITSEQFFLLLVVWLQDHESPISLQYYYYFSSWTKYSFILPDSQCHLVTTTLVFQGWVACCGTTYHTACNLI